MIFIENLEHRDWDLSGDIVPAVIPIFLSAEKADKKDFPFHRG
jgi:hypothetical protein